MPARARSLTREKFWYPGLCPHLEYIHKLSVIGEPVALTPILKALQTDEEINGAK